jgi:6-phosphogluconate dehydrogenase (decarboxylating)
MELGMIGLGRMGASMVRRLLRAGHQCVVYDVQPQAVEALARDGAIGATSLEDLTQSCAEFGGHQEGRRHKRQPVPPARTRWCSSA